jgi:hypothetical protein
VDTAGILHPNHTKYLSPSVTPPPPSSLIWWILLVFFIQTINLSPSVTHSRPHLSSGREKVDTAGIPHPNHAVYLSPSVTHSPPSSLIWWILLVFFIQTILNISLPHLLPPLPHLSSGEERWILLVLFFHTIPYSSLPHLLTPLPHCHLVRRGGYCWYSSSKPYCIALSLTYLLTPLPHLSSGKERWLLLVFFIQTINLSPSVTYSPPSSLIW